VKEEEEEEEEEEVEMEKMNKGEEEEEESMEEEKSSSSNNCCISTSGTGSRSQFPAFISVSSVGAFFADFDTAAIVASDDVQIRANFTL
jgi:hypothetical protein